MSNQRWRALARELGFRAYEAPAIYAPDDLEMNLRNASGMTLAILSDSQADGMPLTNDDLTTMRAEVEPQKQALLQLVRFLWSDAVNRQLQGVKDVTRL